MLELLEQLAVRAAAGILERHERVVLAESCTAGLVANWLSCVPGASQWLCGSAVVYRNETKTAWLGVNAASLADPAIGPVSAATASAMCRGVLATTPEATLAVSVTGHLGPQAPPNLDGQIYIGVLRREVGEHPVPAEVLPVRLAAVLPKDSPFASLRRYRQHEAARCVLEKLIFTVESLPDRSGSVRTG